MEPKVPERQPSSPLSFGGPWTEQKLNVVEKYLDAYTTALKDRPFQLMYIDAFAGTGRITRRNGQPPRLVLPLRQARRDFLEGSAMRAMRIEGKSFDRLIWIEQDTEYYGALRRIRDEHRDRRIQIYNRDANDFLLRHNFDNYGWRGVLLLDPFGTEVRWETITRIAQLQMLDMWFLFPVWAIERLLPRTGILPNDFDGRKRLDAVYGSNAWMKLYDLVPSRSLFGTTRECPWREQGAQGLTKIYKDQLKALFGNRLLEETLPLMNSRNRVLFELMFCVGHPNGIDLAKRIARHLMRGLVQTR